MIEQLRVEFLAWRVGVYCRARSEFLQELYCLFHCGERHRCMFFCIMTVRAAIGWSR